MDMGKFGRIVEGSDVAFVRHQRGSVEIKNDEDKVHDVHIYRAVVIIFGLCSTLRKKSMKNCRGSR